MKVLDRVWLNCLRMWEWISTNLPKGFSESSNSMKMYVIESLKRRWLRENKFTKLMENDCFFCAYDKKHGNECASCPARLVRKGFHCTDRDYHFAHDPIAFYQRITEFNSKRKA